MRRLLLAALPLLCGGALAAAPLPFTGLDLSGTYTCTGHDAQEGDYSGIITLGINKDQSTGKLGSYNLKLAVPGDGDYLGQAVSDGSYLAATFASAKPGSKDYGLGLAPITQDAAGVKHFSKYYYEPEYRGGDHGTEDCTRQ